MDVVDDINSLVPVNADDKEELLPTVDSFQWIDVLTESFITLIIAFSVLYFILEVNEVANVDKMDNYNSVNNIIETVYLIIAFASVIFHLIRFRWNRNSFELIKFDNYPMLFVMVIVFLIDIGYYFMNFISIGTKPINVSRIFSTTAELLFVVGVLPFVITCVCNNVSSTADMMMAVKTKFTILLAMGGCLVIFMRKVSLKIEKDVIMTTANSSYSNDIEHIIYNRVSLAEEILELIDINYILIALVFLIDPLRKVSNFTSEQNDGSYSSINLTKSLTTGVSLVRFRWPTIVLSTILVAILLVTSYVVTPIMDSKSLDHGLQSKTLVIYLAVTSLSYIIGIVYGSIYYFSEIRTWPLRDGTYVVNDEHFNKFTSSFQIIYAGCMIILCLSYLSIRDDYVCLFVVQFFDFLFLAIQVLVQAGCINSGIRREVQCNEISHWKSQLFPPVALASINFGFMVISMVYSQNPIFMIFLQDFKSNYLIYIVIKDVALPITVLNRLHGMAFFINLSIKQWHGKSTIS